MSFRTHQGAKIGIIIVNCHMMLTKLPLRVLNKSSKGEENSCIFLVANKPLLWIYEVKTSIDNTPGQCCLFLDSSFFFSAQLAFFFRLKFQNFNLCLKSWHWPSIFLFMNIYFANLDSYFLSCIWCILQVSTYVLCFQPVFTIGIILSTTECHKRCCLEYYFLHNW